MPIGVGAGMAISGLSSLMGGLFGKKSANTANSSFSNTTKQSSTGSSSSKVKRDLLAEQEGMLGPLFQAAYGKMTNPGQYLDPIRSGLRESVNTKYGNADELLRKRLMRSGGAQSGKMGTATRQMEMARFGELGGVESDMAKMILEQQEQGLSLGERLLGMNFGQSVDGTTSQDSTSTQSGTGQQQYPTAGGAAGALGGGLDALTTILALNKILQGGGNPGTGSDYLSLPSRPLSNNLIDILNPNR